MDHQRTTFTAMRQQCSKVAPVDDRHLDMIGQQPFATPSINTSRGINIGAVISEWVRVNFETSIEPKTSRHAAH